MNLLLMLVNILFLWVYLYYFFTYLPRYMLTEKTFKELRESAGLNVVDLALKLGKSASTIHKWERENTNPGRLVMEYMHALIPPRKVGNESFTFIDLFAGIGGFRKGFEFLGGKCVFTSEWDRYSQQTYNANYLPDHAVEGDITKIPVTEIPKHDVLLAGFPCQPFSLAGVSKKNSLGRSHGFLDETQGTLFFDLAKIIEHHRPKAFLLENVKNLASHDGRKTFAVIKKVLEEELEYEVSTRIIDARSWVPQHRERIFIAGFAKGTGFSLDNLVLPPSELAPRLKTILHGLDDEDEDPFFEKGYVNPKYTLSSNLWTYLQDYKKKHQEKGNGFGFGIFGPEDVARTLSARYHKDGSEILIKQDEFEIPRRLTPRECARLMGFDLPGEKSFIIPVSDTQAYRQFGNSVAVPVVKAVGRHMLPFILGNNREKIIKLDAGYIHA